MKRRGITRRLLASVLAATLFISEPMHVGAAEEIEPAAETVIIEEDVVDGVVEDEISVVDGELLPDYQEPSDAQFPDVEIDGDISVKDDAISKADATLLSEELSVNLPDYNEMFPGLLEDTLSSYEMDEKQALLEADKAHEDSTEGIDYVAGEIIVEAENEEEALEYAKAFNGELKEYGYKIATISLNADDEYKHASVMDAVCASSLEVTSLPAAWPNYCNYSYEGEYEEYTDFDEIVPFDGGDVEDSNDIDRETIRTTGDPFLSNGNAMCQWYHNLIGSDFAWGAGYTGKGINVCILDSGINASHEDIAGNLKGYTGFNSTGNSSADSVGHGSNVAGIVAAVGDNGKGGRGIAYEANLYTINVGGTFSDPKKSDIKDDNVIRGINHAVQVYKADVINISIGGAYYNRLYENATMEAYRSGTAIFTSAGNDSTNAIQYPAGYTGTISVAAVNENNAKTGFSNSGRVNFSAPGILMWSADYNGSNAYVCMSGTSQASPVCAGIAAVALSSGKVTGEGSKRVDNLKAFMAKGCIPSGLGKGTPHLGKMFGLGMSDKAPGAPTVSPSSVKPGTVKAESASVELLVGGANPATDPQFTVYYTLNGANVSYKNGVVGSNTYRYTRPINVSGKSKVTIKAIAVNEYNNLAGRQASFTYVLKPNVRAINIRTLYGINTLQPGCSTQLKAWAFPDYAANKAVKWYVGEIGKSSIDGASISKSGVLKIDSKYAADTIDVYAEAKDAGKATGYARFSIFKGTPISKIKLKENKATLTNGNTYSVPITELSYKDGTQIVTDMKNYLSTATSNSMVASARVDGNNVIISGYNKGKATITVFSSQGAPVTAKISVTVKQSVGGLNVLLPSGAAVLKGKTIKPTLSIYPENADNKKVTWSVLKESGEALSDASVKVNANTGVVTASQNAAVGRYYLKAVSIDNPDASSMVAFRVVDNGIQKINVSATTERLFRTSNGFNTPTHKTLKVEVTNGNLECLEIRNPNPLLLNATIKGDTISLDSTGRGTGKVKLVIASTDGTNVKKSVVVSVVNSLTDMYICAPKGRELNIGSTGGVFLAKGKKIKLSPVFGTDNGAIDRLGKKVKWESSNSAYASVDSNGVVTANINAYKTVAGEVLRAEIKATAEDGRVAHFYVYPCGVIKKMYPTLSAGWIRKGTKGAVFVYAPLKDAENGALSSGRYNVTVSKPGLAAKVEAVANNGAQITFVGNKKGLYTVKVSSADGNTCGTSFKVLVK